MISNTKLNPTVTKLFIRVKHVSCFYRSILFCCTKNIGLNSTYYFNIKIPNKREIQQIATNHWSDVDFKDLHRNSKTYKGLTKNLYKK